MPKSTEALIKEAQKDAEKYSKEREDECKPIATEVLKLIAGANVPIGSINAHDYDKINAIAKAVLELMLIKDVKYADRLFLFQLVLQAVENIKEVVMKSLNNSFDKAIEKSFNGKSFLDVRMSDIDNLLKAGRA